MTPPPSSIPPSPLSRRERQIMDVIYAAGEASAALVLQKLSDPPSYSAVRALLRILEEKGHLQHRSEGGKYIFRPTRPRGREGRPPCGGCSRRSSTTPPLKRWRR